ncbi:hypothetical protein [Aromatoleum petrolei]|uniref:Uncharacterized protein n=1 Tax=Aromatoleum petrolei TaxID=76116 RepID=A0ABX1MUU8_9RHOO|nr:hypothetical protein [Aromatoleum petrolei]NMF91000.1 hypothetical protein [Aromatoleum petrolei]QTQ36755.1 Uncharacterized protein ToN1_26150 [Aromatoleum petrolei]
MSKRVQDIRFVDQRALTLVVDIAVLLEQSEKNKGTWLGSAFARSAATNAGLLLECVSNSCIGSLALPTRLLEELDKLPALSKLDYYLFSRTNKHIDRGCRETELAADVLKLRDHIVHPKLKPGSLAGVGEEQYVDYGATKALGIALDNREWTHEDGKKVADAATAFLSLYFLDWCGHDKGNATRVLVCRERDILQRELAMWVTMRRAERDLIQKWLPATLSFMDLRPSEREV